MFKKTVFIMTLAFSAILPLTLFAQNIDTNAINNEKLIESYTDKTPKNPGGGDSKGLLDRIANPNEAPKVYTGERIVNSTWGTAPVSFDETTGILTVEAGKLKIKDWQIIIKL